MRALLERHMEVEYIRTSNKEEATRSALNRFLARREVSERNKDLVNTYLRDAALGMTVKGRAKTRIQAARRLCYLNSLQMLIDYLRKDLDMLTLEDMQRFIEALEGGQIRSRKRKRVGKQYFVDGGPLSPRYIVDIKTNIRRYYKYLLGGCKTYPPLVDWLDVARPKKEISALTEQEVQRMIDSARCIRDRALVQVFFDGGFRLGEFINIRLQNVAFREVEAGQRCFFLRAPYSKTIPRTVVLPMAESTKWLTYWLEQHPAKPSILPDGTIAAPDPTVQLFPMRPGQIGEVLRRLGPASIGRHVHPHLMRHTSATYWANKLPYFKFCKRFGWTMTSSMPQRYIDAAGVDEVDTARIYRESTAGELAKKEERNRRLMEAIQQALDAAQ